MRQEERKRIIDQILAAVESACRIGIAGHIRPDGDCIGSQIALAEGLAALGKEIFVWNADPVPPRYRFLDTDNRIREAQEGEKVDLLFVVDAAALERIGNTWARVQKPVPLINIDHHPTNPGFGEINWIEADKPATGQLIYYLFREGGWRLNASAANALLAAIMTDTGSFQYPSTMPETFEIAADLLRSGADLGNIARHVYQSNTMGRVRLLRHLYTHFRLSKDQQIAWLWLRPSDFERSKAERWEAEDLIDHLRSIEPVVLACIFEQVGPELVRVSMRSKDPKIDLSQIAMRFGGGGHRSAAGARIKGRPRLIQRQILSAFKEALVALDLQVKSEGILR